MVTEHGGVDSVVCIDLKASLSFALRPLTWTTVTQLAEDGKLCRSPLRRAILWATVNGNR